MPPDLEPAPAETVQPAPPPAPAAAPEVAAFAFPEADEDSGLGGGSAESALAAFGHFADDATPFEDLLTGPQPEAETATPYEDMVAGPQLEVETATPFENQPTGPQPAAETATSSPQPAAPNKAAIAAELGTIDWTTKGGVDTFRQRLRSVSAEERVALIKSLPEGSQSIGFCALQLATADDQFTKNATAGLAAASDEGKLDEKTIRSNLRNVPKDQRDKALAGLPEAERKQAQDQLAKDDAILESNAGAVEMLKQLDPKNPNAIVGDARMALRSVDPAQRAAIIENLPSDQRGMAWAAIGMVAADDVKAAAAVTKLKESGDKLDAATIHAQLRDIPPEMRDRALAALPADAKQKVADQSAKDRESIAANRPAVAQLACMDFAKPGTYQAAVATLATVPAAQRAAIIESLPPDQRACASIAVGTVYQQEASATVGVDLLKKASAAGVPDDKAIETSLALMQPAVRAKALAELPEATRAAVEAKVVEGKERAAEGVKLLMTAGGGKAVDKEAVHKALKDLPAWEKQNVLNSLSAEAKEAAEAGLADIEKCDAAKKAVEALAGTGEEGVSIEAIDDALKGVPAERYAEMKAELSPAAQAELTLREKAYQASLASKLENIDTGPASVFGNGDDELKDHVSEIPAGMRDAAVNGLPESKEKDLATTALTEVKDAEERKRQYEATTAKKIDAGAKEFADLAKAAPKPKEGDDPGAVEDAQKQYDKKVQETLARIPYRERDKALAAMDPEARKLAESAIATKKAEMKGKAEKLFNAINAGMLENGTDTTTILQTLATLTPDERRELEDQYGDTFKKEGGKARDLEADLMAEFKDEKGVLGNTTRSYKLDREFIQAAFSNNPAETKAIALQLAARGSSSTDCTDEALIMKTLESIKDPKEREETFKIFKERQEKAGASETSVKQMLRSEMVTGDVDKNDYEYKRALALSDGEFEDAKSVEIEEAMDPGLMGKVSVRDIAAVGGAIIPGGALISGAVGLADAAGVIDADRKVGEPDVERAAGVFATADSQKERDKIDAHHAANNGGKTVGDIARERSPRKEDALLVESAQTNDKVGMKAARWKRAENQANSNEQGMQKELEGKQHKDVIARIDREFGEGEFEKRSKAVMNEEELAANKELAESGKVKPITGLLATMPPVSTGWALEDIEKHLKDPTDPKKLLSKDDMIALKKELCEKQDMTEEEFDEMIDLKLGGKDAFRLRQMMKGEPANRAERMERMKEEQDFNREGLGNLAGKLVTDQFSTAGESQDANYKLLQEADARMTELEAKKKDGTITEVETAQLAKEEKDLEDRADSFGVNVKSYQASRDTISNDITTIAAATAGAIATVATGGAAGPIVGALIAGLTTIASKNALLGGTYNERDQLKDELQTLLSVGAAGASAGAGPAIDAIANKMGGAAANLLKGPAGEVIKELVAAGTKGTLGGGLSGLMSSTGGVLLDEKTLQGKGDVGEMAKKVGFGTLSSAAGGGASAVIGKGLDLGGLQSADPTKTYSAGGHLANKALSSAGGDAVSFIADPANHNGPDQMGKLVQKHLMGIPANAIGAYGDHRTATKARIENARALGIPEADIDNPEHQTRLNDYGAFKAKNPGFMDGTPLTDEEKAFKAQQDAELKKLTKPVDDDTIPIHLETDDFDPRLQTKPAKPELSLEEQAAEKGCGADAARQAAALALKKSIPLDEAIERVRQDRNVRPDFTEETNDKLDSILDGVNKSADANHRTNLETDALKQGVDPETAKLAAQLADDGPLPLDEAIAFAKHQRAFQPDSPELAAAKTKTDEMLAKLPPPARDLVEILPKAPKAGMKNTGDEGDSRGSSESAFRRSREGMHEETTNTIVKGKDFVLRGSEEGAVEPYGDVKTISSQRLETEDAQENPIIKLATDERIIMQIPDSADPTIVSTHFENCGATIIRGVDPKTGKAVLLVGHVTEDDALGHGKRFEDDLKALKSQGITNLEVVVMPSFNDEPNKQMPALAKLQEQAGEGVKITEIPRPGGPKEHAHIVVTKDGVTVYTGDFDPNNPPQVLKNHEFAGTI